MKLGWLEIALIIFVIIAIAIIARIVRPGRAAYQKNDRYPASTNRHQTDRHAKILGRTGIALIIAGGIALVAGISMLQWVIHNYVLSVILIVIGIIVLMISRRRR